MAKFRKADEIYSLDLTDKRVMEYALREGLISPEDVEKQLSDLEDLSAEFDVLEIDEEEEIRVRAELKEKRKELAQAKKNALTN